MSRLYQPWDSHLLPLFQISTTETAIVEGIAQILADEEASCPVQLRGYRLLSLELSQLVAGTKYRGEFEERLQAIMQELTDPKAPPTILFIDEVRTKEKMIVICYPIVILIYAFIFNSKSDSQSCRGRCSRGWYGC